MSLPSIAVIARERGFVLGALNAAQREEVLVEGMRRDLPLATSFLHRKAHEADKVGGSIDWSVDPNSDLGKQLIRLHASDALRPLASKHFCHDKALAFVNCCNGKVGTPPKDLLQFQIECQAGPIAFADC